VAVRLSVEQEVDSVLSLESVRKGSGLQQASWRLTASWLNAGPSRRQAIHARTARLFQGSETVRWGPGARELISNPHLGYHLGDSWFAVECLGTDKAATVNAAMG
jgi:hypothetical protein